VTRFRAIIAGIVDFVAGDDLTLAVGVVLTMTATYLLGRSGTGAWWLPPTAVTALVGVSIWRAVRRKA
jgi:hypothetical protein